jgi:DNA-binding Xre family transcriptional regulator
MQQQLDQLKMEVTKRVYKLFMEKFAGNKSQFAKAAGCDEKTLRLLFEQNQGMTLNLLFKLSFALNVTPSDLLNGIELKGK